MKKTLNLLALVAIALFLGACTNNENLPTQGEGTINFQVLNYEQVSLDEVTRAAEATTLAHLEMAIYDAVSKELVSNTRMNKGEEHYGEFSATLPYGDYIILFMGYDGTRLTFLDNLNAIRFSDSYVPNFFYKTLYIKFNAATELNQAIALERGVAAFCVKNTSSVPNDISSLSVTTEESGIEFNAETGYAPRTQSLTRTYDATGIAGLESFTITYYTFLPQEETKMTFVISTYNTEKKLIKARTFSDVPMKINQRTIYTGAFFDSSDQSQAFSLSLTNNVWDDINLTY